MTLMTVSGRIFVSPTGVCRQKASRAAAWAQHQEDLRMKNMSTLPKSMEIQTGDIVAVQMATSWNVALVLSIYRIYKKGSGAQLFASELAKGCLHSARIVIMQEVHNEQAVVSVVSSNAMQTVRVWWSPQTRWASSWNHLLPEKTQELMDRRLFWESQTYSSK